VQAGTVLDAVAPATAWQLTGRHGAVVRPTSSFGYAATFHVPRPETVTVAFVGSWVHGLEIGIETAAWIVVAAALAGRRWWLDWWWGPIGGKGASRRRRGGFPHDAGTSDITEPLLEPSPDASPEPSGPVSEVVT
jgi:hypothetical protein